jgi:predicted alpha/beta superfamily hydrolase
MEGIYKTETLLRRQLRVRYPVKNGGRIVLRTELDWDKDLEPESVSDNGQTFLFSLECKKPFVYFKALLQTGDQYQWSAGPNMLILMTHQRTNDMFPFFDSPETGSFTDVLEFDSAILGRKHRLRVYIPPGYHENTLQSYSTLYMQDGKNLFFPEEAFLGSEWHVDESLTLLNKLTSIDRVIVVGIWSEDRFVDYTKPGYEKYGRAVVEEIIPYVKKNFRCMGGPRETGVMGSSLGGVVSFYMAWQYPKVFGSAFCLSSTFSYQDDLIDRVLSEPMPTSRFYLDSGWPEDNSEVTLAMAMAMYQRGWIAGKNFLHVIFPLALHDEKSWGERLHLPLQLFLGKASTADRRRKSEP